MKWRPWRSPPWVILLPKELCMSWLNVLLLYRRWRLRRTWRDCRRDRDWQSQGRYPIPRSRSDYQIPCRTWRYRRSNLNLLLKSFVIQSIKLIKTHILKLKLMKRSEKLSMKSIPTRKDHLPPKLPLRKPPRNKNPLKLNKKLLSKSNKRPPKNKKPNLNLLNKKLPSPKPGNAQNVGKRYPACVWKSPSVSKTPKTPMLSSPPSKKWTWAVPWNCAKNSKFLSYSG